MARMEPTTAKRWNLRAVQTKLQLWRRGILQASCEMGAERQQGLARVLQLSRSVDLAEDRVL